MAAGLPSFQSNDKQMQAIRELTNEVFNLKLNTKKNSNRIAALEEQEPYIKRYIIERTTLTYESPVTVNAGSLSNLQTFTVTPPTGYKVLSVIVNALTNATGMAEGILPVSAIYSANNAVVLKVFNPTSSELVLKIAYVTIIYEKIIA